MCDLINDAIVNTPLNSRIDIKKLSGEGVELMQEWEGYDLIFLADASRSSGSAGRVTRIDSSSTPLQQDYFNYSSHNFSLAEAVELSRQLGTLPKRLIVYAIEGKNFSHGVEITDEVEFSCSNTARKILEEIAFFR